MLVYEKWVTNQSTNELERHLFGTEGNIPSNSDNQLVYQDADGDAVTPSLSNTFVDNRNGGIIMIDSDGKETFVAVNIKKSDNSLINIVPGGNYEPAEKVLKSIKFKKKPSTITYTEGDKLDLTGAVIEATFESGEKEIITDDCTFSPADGDTLATTDTTITASYTYPAEGASQVTKTATCTITVEADSNQDSNQ